MSYQEPLFVDSIHESMNALVMGSGGYKKVGAQLWPALPVDRAGRDLADCLNPDNPRKLSLNEVMALLRIGREQNVHTAIGFICESAGYSIPTPVDPETEKQRLQREFIAAAQLMSRIGERLGVLEEGLPKPKLRVA